MAKAKKPFHEEVAERLIEQLKAGTAPWQKPWEPGMPGAFIPMNPTTGKRYKGINAIQLMSQGHTDPRWMTYKQAAAEGAQVRRGEKGTPIQYWKFTEQQPKLDEQTGKPIRDDNGDVVKITVQLERPRVFFATVFNAEQIDGLPPLERKPQAWDAIERAEHILEASGATIRHGEHDRAFYRSATDSIHLPDRGQFPSADNYYATALHELGHWSGHPSRLDRDLSHPFGSEGYAKEELRAEIASMILGDELGIGHDPGQHAAYVGSWIKALQEDPLEIFRAAADAEKIHGYVMAFEQKQVQEQGQELSQAVEADLGPRWTVERRDTFAANPEQVVIGETNSAVEALTLFRSKPDTIVTDNRTETVEGRTDWVRDGAAPEWLPSPKLVAMANMEERGVPLPQPRPGVDTADYRLAETLLLAANHPEPGSHSQQRLMKAAVDATADAFGEPLGGIRNGKLPEQWNGTARAVPVALRGSYEAGDVEYVPVEQGQHTHWLVETQDAADNWHWFATDFNHEGAEAVTTAKRLNTIGEVAGLSAGQQAQHQEQANMQASSNEAAALLASYPADVSQGIKQAAGVRRQIDQGEIDGQAFVAATRQLLGVELPPDWSGELRIVGVAEQDGQTVDAAQAGIKPQAYQVYARKADAQYGEDAFAFVAGTRTEKQAQELAERLHLVDALGTANPHERAAKIARIQEDRVGHDPNSTNEQISAAKETRKELEAKAFIEAEALENAQQERTDVAKYQAQQQAKGPTYLNVPYREKDEVKELGAKWDRQKRAWYVPTGVDPAPFSRWAQAGAQEAQPTPNHSTGDAETRGENTTQERTYLAVPYGERGAAKAAGARWDKSAKSWYVGPNADMKKLQRWLPDNVPNQQGPAMSPREEFAEALQSVGCVVSGEHPVMDGKKHRIPAEGDKRGEKSGFYVGHLDGHPAGYIKNNRTGVEMKWKSKGYSLDPEEKARLQAEAATKLAARAAEQQRLQENAATRVAQQVESLVPATKPTPYMESKGIQAHPGALTDNEGKKTYLPAIDADGKQWTMQYINEDGTKRFAKDSRKEGCFHVVGGDMKALEAAPALVLQEGYATAATNAEALGFATVAAFDSGNLEAVAKDLHQRYPDKPIIIAGDDDRALAMIQGTNPGKEKAVAAARAVGGTWTTPKFAPDEAAYPKDLPSITPDNYRAHLEATATLKDKPDLSNEQTAKLKAKQLSGDQLSALNRMKRFTDFNDLATRSKLGREAVTRQMRAVVTNAIEKVQKREQQQTRQQTHEKKRAFSR